MLYPTADGSEFLMGPDVRKGVDDTYKTECGNPSGSKCLEAIIEVLRGDDDGLAKDAGKRSLFNRQVDPIGAAAVLAGSVIVGVYKKLDAEKPIPIDIHLRHQLQANLYSRQQTTM